MKLSDTIRIRLTGRGGQGIMLAGAILADAAMRDGRQVTETQEYGPEARLGATRADVILSDRPIAFPEVEQADILLCLSRGGWLKYGTQVASGALRLVDVTAVAREPGDPEVRSFPWRARARELGDEVVTNMMALGTLQAVTQVVSVKSLREVLQERIKPALVAANLAAFDEGVNLGREELSAPDVATAGRNAGRQGGEIHD